MKKRLTCGRVLPSIALIAALGILPSSGYAETASPQSPPLKQGIAYYQKGYVQKAISWFQLAVKATPENEEANLWLAKALQKQGGAENLEQARIAFERVLKANPSNIEALTRLGEILTWDPDIRESGLEMLAKAAQAQPDNPDVIKPLVQALAWAGRYEEALRFADPIAPKLASDKAWLATYAEVLSHNNRGEEAIGIYTKDLQIAQSPDPQQHQAYARILYQSGQQAEAKKVFEDLKTQMMTLPEDKQLLWKPSMAALAYDLGAYDEALAMDQSLPEETSQNGKAIRLRMARSFVNLGQSANAAALFQKLHEEGHLNANEKLEYGDVLLSLPPDPQSPTGSSQIEAIYKEALGESPQSAQGEVYLRLARYYSRYTDHFAQTVQAYQDALKSTSPKEAPGIQKEFLDFLKASRTNLPETDKAFQDLLAKTPQDPQVKGAYAEFLSWQEAQRPAAMKLYLALMGEDSQNRKAWEEGLEQTLSWHRPSIDLVPLYQEILTVVPESKGAHLSLARAYRTAPKHYRDALNTYQDLVKRYPTDPVIGKEWADVLLSDEAHRKESLEVLERLTQANPSDLSTKIAYGKLLSYQHQFSKALDVFDSILSKEPENRDALLGKGLTLLWDSQKLSAKKILLQARETYPKDMEITMALAQVEKSLGRYDRALDLLKEMKQYLNHVQPVRDHYLLCAYETSGAPVPKVTYDFSILPYSEPLPVPRAPQPVRQSSPSYRPLNTSSFQHQPAHTSPTQGHQGEGTGSEVSTQPTAPTELQDDLQSLHQSIETLKALQQNTNQQLEKMNYSLSDVKENLPGEVRISDEDSKTLPSSRNLEGPMAQYSAIDYDTNPLLSGVGRFRTAPLGGLEQSLENDLRPMFRAGYSFLVQDGERTTTRLRGYGFPNQLSFSLTPQLRLRGGISPQRLYLPRPAISPSSTWGTQYSMGATAKYWDRLTLDGDFALTEFNQSDSLSITYQASAKFDVTDRVHIKLGSRRDPLQNSLLSYAGFRPTRGAFDGKLVGQARENDFYAELNTNPFSHVDFNLGYEFGFVDGSRIPSNYKNQAFTSLGYTIPLGDHHSARVGYEFLFFGYEKNATLGYFDMKGSNRRPLVVLNPITVAPGGTVFGGYFSPEQFYLNALRLDLRGSFFNKFIEYKLGGSVGVQTFTPGHHIPQPNPTSFASSFDGNVLFNMTDWLSLYADGNFLDAGGLFNRWRFGGGVILRPNIPALSPVIGKR